VVVVCDHNHLIHSSLYIIGAICISKNWKTKQTFVVLIRKTEEAVF
jgi:hypothetical protein